METNNIIDIRTFKEGDEINIQKMECGCAVMYTCKFISYKGGVITATAVKASRRYKIHGLPKTITARCDKAFLTGLNPTHPSQCTWFNSKGIITTK